MSPVDGGGRGAGGPPDPGEAGRLAAIVESAPDALVCVDRDGLIVFVNGQVESIFGYTRAELLGRPVEALVPLRAQAVHRVQRAGFSRNPGHRPMGTSLQLAAVRKDGSEFPVDISLSSFETGEGRLVVAAVRDITERRRIEEERALLEKQLEQSRQDEERRALEAQLHQAQRLETVGRLAGGIAHDFNNLLAGIMNYSALVTDGLAALSTRLGLGDEAEVALIAQDVAEITSVARRAAQLTHQLLVFSRRDLVKAEVLELNGLVADMEKLLRRTIGEAIDLRTALALELPHVKVDRGQIE